MSLSALERKPPLGLRPQGIWRERVLSERFEEVLAAIVRYLAAGRTPSTEWVSELASLQAEIGHPSISKKVHFSATRHFLIETRSSSFRSGVPAEIIGVDVLRGLDDSPMPCYVIRFEDGQETKVPLVDRSNFIIVTEP